MKYLFCLLCCGFIHFSAAQETERAERPLFLYAEFGGGLFAIVRTMDYSIESPRLTGMAQSIFPPIIVFLTGQVGLRWLERHHFGVGFENIRLNNYFTYITEILSDF
jgi:hypothetical protein